MGNNTQEHHKTMTRKEIWRVFFILLFVTILEFIVALGIPTSIMGQGVKNFLYIIMTIIKAFYIVAYFMHMKYEKIIFQAIIILNMLFMVYLIILMLIEGNALLNSQT